MSRNNQKTQKISNSLQSVNPLRIHIKMQIKCISQPERANQRFSHERVWSDSVHLSFEDSWSICTQASDLAPLRY